MLNIEELSKKLVIERSNQIDREFISFLNENGFDSSEVTQLRKELNKKGFQIIQETQKTPEGETITFKICKIINTKVLNILNPKFVLEEECQCECHFISTTGCKCNCNK